MGKTQTDHAPGAAAESGAHADPWAAHGESDSAVVIAERAAFWALAAELSAERQVLVVGEADTRIFDDASGIRVTDMSSAGGAATGAFDVVAVDIDRADEAAIALVESLPSLADQGIAVIRLPNRPDCLDLYEQIVASFPNRRVFRQHNWVASAILDDRLFAGGDAAAAFVSSSRKLAGAAIDTALYTIVVAGAGALPDIAPQVVLTRSLDLREMLDRETAAYARARAAEIEAQLARDSQLDRIRELEAKTAWLQTLELDLQNEVERRGWTMRLVKTWVIVVRVTRRINQLLHR
ncbi:MAG: hypothetical protein WBK99_07625 [Solirubrobacterales bacterium]